MIFNRVPLLLGAFLMILPASDSHAQADRPASDRLLSDFTSATADLGWYVVNDNVMGGRSRGGFSAEGTALHFRGRTNTNGGGFRLPGPALDPSQITGMGLMIYDKRDGAFGLRLDSVQAYVEAPRRPLDVYKGKQRLLVLSAPSRSDEMPMRKMEVEKRSRP